MGRKKIIIQPNIRLLSVRWVMQTALSWELPAPRWDGGRRQWTPPSILPSSFHSAFSLLHIYCISTHVIWRKKKITSTANTTAWKTTAAGRPFLTPAELLQHTAASLATWDAGACLEEAGDVLGTGAAARPFVPTCCTQGPARPSAPPFHEEMPGGHPVSCEPY